MEYFMFSRMWQKCWHISHLWGTVDRKSILTQSKLQANLRGFIFDDLHFSLLNLLSNIHLCLNFQCSLSCFPHLKAGSLFILSSWGPHRPNSDFSQLFLLSFHSILELSPSHIHSDCTHISLFHPQTCGPQVLLFLLQVSPKVTLSTKILLPNECFLIVGFLSIPLYLFLVTSSLSFT